MFCVADCVADRVRFAIPQPTEWQHIGDEIDAAFVFAWADFVTPVGDDLRQSLTEMKSPTRYVEIICANRVPTRLRQTKKLRKGRP